MEISATRTKPQTESYAEVTSDPADTDYDWHSPSFVELLEQAVVVILG